MFKTVIFDLDGTVLDTLSDLSSSANMFCRMKGWKEHSKEEYKSFIGYGMKKFVESFSPCDKRSEEEIKKTINEYVDIYKEYEEKDTKVFDGIQELIDTLRSLGIKTGILTNKNDESAKIMVSHYLFPMPDKVRGKVSGFKVKPDIQSLLALMEELNAQKDSVILVGDSEADIKTAKNAGIKSCGVLWGYRKKEDLAAAGADYIVKDTDELLKIILK